MTCVRRRACGTGGRWGGVEPPPVFGPSHPHRWLQPLSQDFLYEPTVRRRLQDLSQDESQPESSSQLSGSALLHVSESPSRRPTSSS